MASGSAISGVRALAASLAAALVVPGAAFAGGAACDGGRFVVSAPLLPGRTSGGDAIEIAAGRLAVDGGCGATAAKLRRTRKGTKVTAKWKQCAGQPGKVKLTALFDASCETLTGKISVAKMKPRFASSFAAALETTTRTCDFVPGPTTLAPPALGPTASLEPRRRPPIRPNDPRYQEGFLRSLWDLIADVYVHPDLNGVDWDAVLDEYLAKIAAGLTADEFYDAMAELVEELGDDHSHFLDPIEVAAEEEQLAGGASFIGMGVRLDDLPDTSEAVVLFVWPNSPAAEAGLRAHDVVVAIDGVPYLDEEGEPIDPPAAGVPFELTWRRPGGAEQTSTIVRRAVGGFDPLDHCVVPGTQILYLALPSLFDVTFAPRVRRILEKVAAEEPLEGLLIDNRRNPGGSSNVAFPMLGLFTSGEQGRFVHRDGSENPVVAEPVVNAGGSQTVPLAIAIGPDTVSFGEVFSGSLQNSGRAILVGEPSRGNVEVLSGFEFIDDSVAWIANAEYAPAGLPAGVWEGVGVEPDESAPSVWHEITEANDPAIAAAVELFTAPN
jgi:carboxyl-terminal processing protease